MGNYEHRRVKDQELAEKEEMDQSVAESKSRTKQATEQLANTLKHTMTCDDTVMTCDVEVAIAVTDSQMLQQTRQTCMHR
jgi:hypothetical protein